ncbi:MAG: T9SS type A sorting domain-containing protein [candidate division Zixibacteria bacterium]|nr:T9SS type A sorting domain-containing protein [candidate division Zixibacteria bacterium]
MSWTKFLTKAIRSKRMNKKKIFVSALFLVFLVSISSAVFGFEIGHRTVTYTDPDRNNREILTELYYPADTGGENVPVADPGPDGFPVISFGHGFLMVWSAYENIWSAVVPNGYIMAFPRTEGDLSPDHLALGLDLAFLIEKLQAEGANPASPFYNKVGTTSAVMGHSMGGGASYLAAESKPDITTIATLAAAETNPSAIQAAANIDMPSLMFAGDDDCVTPPEDHQIPIHNALASDCKTLLEIYGASHCQFANYNFNCSLGEIFCPSPDLNRQQQHDIVNQYLLPYLDYRLKGSGDSWNEFQYIMLTANNADYRQTCREPSLVDINMIPNNPPVTVPAGGFFRFTGVLDNIYTYQIDCDVEVMVGLPGGVLYGPVQEFNNIPLAPGQNITVPGVRQDVPVFAPAGTYNYISYASYNSVFFDSAYFEFTVTAPLLGEASGWNLAGWFDSRTENLPARTELIGNYPNPFNASTTIEMVLAEDSDVSLEVYNIQGQLVETLVNSSMTAGYHNISWHADAFSSGTYFYRLTTGGEVFTRKMVLVK